MKIRIRLFSDFQEVFRKKNLEIEVENEITIMELIKLLTIRFPKMEKLTKYPEYYSILLNGRYSKLTQILKDNDVVDLFTVIEGG